MRELAIECELGEVRFDATKVFAAIDAGLSDHAAVWEEFRPTPSPPFFDMVTAFELTSEACEVPPNVRDLRAIARLLSPGALRSLPALERLHVGASEAEAVALFDRWSCPRVTSLTFDSHPPSNFVTHGAPLSVEVTAAFNASSARNTLTELDAIFPIDEAAASAHLEVLIAAGGLLPGAAAALGSKLHHLVVFRSDVVDEIVEAKLPALSTLMLVQCDLSGGRLARLARLRELSDLTIAHCRYEPEAQTALREALSEVPMVTFV